MKTKYKYAKRIPERFTLQDTLQTFHEDTSLSHLLLRLSTGQPINDFIRNARYLEGIPARPSTDLTDYDRTSKLINNIKQKYDINQDTLKSLSEKLSKQPDDLNKILTSDTPPAS